MQLSIPVPFDGGCPCGAVRFRGEAVPVAMYNCHCPGCQKLSGAPFAPLVVLPLARVRMTGDLKRPAQAVRDDKHGERFCCARCGFPVLARSDAQAEVCMLNVMSVDDPSWFHPVADIWTAYAQPWVRLDRHIPKVHKSPPVLGGEVV
ncbi:GFA family protein [Noviherbaspirillum aridicola]|uniref:Aldehyde-activating protein n=1 Tax=Noviherbaspirillum aridicola TaxID=2849687 RepID=A0ABQ4PZX3_9BURK|nr:GFA family protein [Noviherbaspirillum aridicola]GIZ50446.1 aldehyde-activating protein [Noviherbaspirillum aridicola]